MTGAELIMHYVLLIVTLSNEEKVGAVVPVTSVGLTYSEAMVAKFLYFVGKVFDENTGKVSTRVNGWQYFRWMSI